MTKMDKGYHVGCSDITGLIYAGKGKRDGAYTEWSSKSEVTSEAINAVMGHMLLKMDRGAEKTAYMNTTRDGRYLRLVLEIADHRPEWLDEELGVDLPDTDAGKMEE